MYNRLKRLYEEGRIDSNGLQNAVNKGWITPKEKDEIENGNTLQAEEYQVMFVNQLEIIDD